MSADDAQTPHSHTYDIHNVYRSSRSGQMGMALATLSYH